MATLISTRLEKGFEEKLRQLAKQKGISISEMHRQALTEYLERETQPPKHSRYDDVIGIAESRGNGELSVNHSRAFIDALNA